MDNYILVIYEHPLESVSIIAAKSDPMLGKQCCGHGENTYPQAVEKAVINTFHRVIPTLWITFHPPCELPVDNKNRYTQSRRKGVATREAT